jgi:hypothetical protein
MSAAASTDVAHTQVTDHRIPRRPAEQSRLSDEISPSPTVPRLVPLPDSLQAEQDIRDLALAWQSLANDGMEGPSRMLRAFCEPRSPSFPMILILCRLWPTLSRSTA